MADVQRFSIIVVPFPYTDQLAEKRRPALVISQTGIDSSLIWVAMITSAKNQGWADDILIKNYTQCGLPAPSLIRPIKFATIDAGRVLNILGQLEDADARAVLRYYRHSFE